MISPAAPNSNVINHHDKGLFFLDLSSMAASVKTHCNAPLPDVSILEVMPGNDQQDNLNKQFARKCYFEFSTCSKVALRFSLFTVDIMGGRKEGTS